jgi:hypothetical protein
MNGSSSRTGVWNAKSVDLLSKWKSLSHPHPVWYQSRMRCKEGKVMTTRQRRLMTWVTVFVVSGAAGVGFSAVGSLLGPVCCAGMFLAAAGVLAETW